MQMYTRPNYYYVDRKPHRLIQKTKRVELMNTYVQTYTHTHTHKYAGINTYTHIHGHTHIHIKRNHSSMLYIEVLR